MGEEMISWLRKCFVENWQRKVFSLILAIVIYFIISHSITITKSFSSVAVRVVNMPKGKTVEGIQDNGHLSRRIPVTLSGSKNVLNALSSSDLEVVIDASDRRKEWIATIARKNLQCVNSDININHGITKVQAKSQIVKLTNHIEENIPVIITQPIGQPPKGYHFIDALPFQVDLPLSGPEDVIKKLKTQGLKLTFNLNNITRAELDALRSTQEDSTNDVVSFHVPETWKQLSVPAISKAPVQLRGQKANDLRLNFVRSTMLPVKQNIAVNLHFPPYSPLPPDKTSIATSDLVTTRNGQKVLSGNFYASGVSELFLQIVKGMVEVSVVVGTKSDGESFDWGIQFINPKKLEDRFITAVMMDREDADSHRNTSWLNEEYLRNRFRSYMNRFTLHKSNFQKLHIYAEQQGNRIILKESDESATP